MFGLRRHPLRQLFVFCSLMLIRTSKELKNAFTPQPPNQVFFSQIQESAKTSRARWGKAWTGLASKRLRLLVRRESCHNHVCVYSWLEKNSENAAVLNIQTLPMHADHDDLRDIRIHLQGRHPLVMILTRGPCETCFCPILVRGRTDDKNLSFPCSGWSSENWWQVLSFWFSPPGALCLHRLRGLTRKHPKKMEQGSVLFIAMSRLFSGGTRVHFGFIPNHFRIENESCCVRTYRRAKWWGKTVLPVHNKQLSDNFERKSLDFKAKQFLVVRVCKMNLITCPSSQIRG